MLKPFPIPTDRDGLVAEIRKRCSEDVRDELLADLAELNDDELADASAALASLLASAEVLRS
jgi:hypothetical protein